MNQQRSNQIFGGVFLIGLAVLSMINWWWPGILFVIGIALMARSIAEGRNWTEERAGIVALAVGIVFALTDVLSIFSFNWLPLVLIALGLFMLFGNRGGYVPRRPRSDDKPKNDSDFV